MAEGNNTEKQMLEDVNRKLLRVLDINQKLEQTVNRLFSEKETFRSKIEERNQILKDRLDKLEQTMLSSLDNVCDGQLASIQRKRNRCLDLANHTQTTIDRLHGEKESITYLAELETINRTLERDLKYLGEGEEKVSLYLMMNDDLEQYVSETESIGSGPSQTNLAASGGIQQQNESASLPIHINNPRAPETKTHHLADDNSAGFLPSTPEPPSYFDVVMPTFPFPHKVTDSKNSEIPKASQLRLLTATEATSTSDISDSKYFAQSTTSDVSCSNNHEQGNTNGPPHGARLTSSFKTKTPSDKKNSRITGATYLSDGKIVLSDRNNKKVKLFTESFDLMAECKLDEYPFDVTETCLGNVAVSVTKMERVLFFDKSLERVIDELETQQPCLGVTAKHDKLYVCCDGTWTDLGCIKVFDLKNTMLWKIDKDMSGKILIGNSKYIDVCPKTGNLYFTKGGFGKSSLYCIECPATVVFKSKLPSVSHYYGSGVPFGIAAIDSGLLLAMSFVKCVTENGRKWEPFVDPSERLRINAVCVNKNQTLMLISQADPSSDCVENNLIRIYQLEY